MKDVKAVLSFLLKITWFTIVIAGLIVFFTKQGGGFISDKAKQTQRIQKWETKNKEHANYLKAWAAVRGFTRNKATLQDLEELKKLIKENEDVLMKKV